MKRHYMKYITALLLFGSNGIVARQIVRSSYEIVLLRTMIGSALLITIFFAGKRRLTFYRHMPQFLALCVSGIAMGASWIFLYEAYAQIGVSIASLLYYCGSILVMALSPILFREKLTLTKIIAFVFVLCGIFLVNGRTFDGNENQFGFLCGVMSAVMYALMVIFNKKAKEIKGLENSMLQLLVSFLTVAVFVGFKQGFAIQLAPSDIVPTLVLGLLNTGIGCYFYFSSIGHLLMQTVAVCGYLEPLSAVLFSMIILHEVLLPLQIVGAACIIGGAVFSEYAVKAARI